MSRKAYTDLVEGTYVEPGHDVAPASERACEAVDACFNVTTGNREMLVRLVDSLMRENEALRMERNCHQECSTSFTARSRRSWSHDH